MLRMDGERLSWISVLFARHYDDDDVDDDDDDDDDDDEQNESIWNTTFLEAFYIMEKSNQSSY